LDPETFPNPSIVASSLISTFGSSTSTLEGIPPEYPARPPPQQNPMLSDLIVLPADVIDTFGARPPI